MLPSFILAVAATVDFVAASPALLRRADYQAPPGGDIDILNYALTLEYLEWKFYQEGLANYTQDDFQKAGFDATFYSNLKEIYVDEQVGTPHSLALALVRCLATLPLPWQSIPTFPLHLFFAAF